MITGKESIDLGYRPSKWFKEAIAFANQKNLTEGSLANYLKSVAPKHIEPFSVPVDFYKKIKADTEAEISNAEQVLSTMAGDWQIDAPWRKQFKNRKNKMTK